MDDDFNTAKTIGCLFELSTLIYSLKDGTIASDKLSNSTIVRIGETFEQYLLDVFGLKPLEENKNSKLDDVMQVLIGIRKEAKLKKDFATSDQIRNELLAKGIQLKDEKDGTVNWNFL